jgi:serine/threonine protein kinase
MAHRSGNLGDPGLDLGLDLDLPPSSAVEPVVQSGDPFRILGTAVQDTFLVEQVVAHGGFAVVYRAKHLRFAAPVALKCLKIPASLTEEERRDFLERFLKEGEVMFRLSGTIPEVVRPLQVDSFGLPDGRLVPFIAFEWLDGETLKDVIVRRLTDGLPPLGVHAAVEILGSVARALHRAHRVPSPEGELCVTHCDLKPDNIFVVNGDAGQFLKIFDFGIAKVRRAASREAGRATAETQGNMFTPAYAAPEQWAPDRFGQTGPWTDVFGLALTVAELAAQRPAIDGPPAAMLAACLDEQSRPTPRKLGVSTDDAVESVFRKALAVNPTQRHRSMEGFWSDLQRALGTEPSLSASRQSVAGVPAQIPDILGPAGAPFGGAFGGAPLAGGPPAPAGPAPEFAGDLDFSLDPVPSARPAQVAHAVAPQPVVVAPPEPPGGSSPHQRGGPPLPPPGLDASAMDFSAGAISFDIADGPGSQPVAPKAGAPAHAAGPGLSLAASPSHGGPELHGSPASHGGPVSQGAPSSHGGAVGAPLGASPAFGAGPAHAAPSAPGPTSARAREIAAVAAAAAARTAEAAARGAVSGARVLATKALEVAPHEIRFDEPSTWIKPMLAPIVMMVLAILSTIVVVIVNKVTRSNTQVTWLSLTLMLASIGFGVYRWLKLTRG